MKEKQFFTALLVSVGLIIFGGVGYLLALEGVPFFLALKSFFIAVLSFGGFLLLFFIATAVLLGIFDFIASFFKSSKKK